VATLYYPGGSQYDKNSVGYDWKNNYLSYLFDAKAVNGLRMHPGFGLLPECCSFAPVLLYSLSNFQGKYLQEAQPKSSDTAESAP
jgi:hypothetical protein